MILSDDHVFHRILATSVEVWGTGSPLRSDDGERSKRHVKTTVEDGDRKKDALVNGFRITVVLLQKLLSVSISYTTAPLALSTRVVFKGEFFVNTSFIAISRGISAVNTKVFERTRLRRRVAVFWGPSHEREAVVLIYSATRAPPAATERLGILTFVEHRIRHENDQYRWSFKKKSGYGCRSSPGRAEKRACGY